MSDKAPIIKNVIHVGQKYVPLSNDSKAYFHFQTYKLGKVRVLLDDSRTMGKREPMVLIIGIKFKLEVWETIVKMMAVGEVASFKVKKELLFSYPFVSKTLRDIGRDAPLRHTCTVSLQHEGLGYPDLDEYMKKPCDLEFIIELIKVEKPCQYEKDIWQLNDEEKINLIPTLREKGNQLYKEKKYAEAEDAYCKAIGICEQMMLREKKDDEDWEKINNIKLPILSNYAQCKLMLKEYYAVIEHCNTILTHEPDNEKALFRRAKAHVGAWNPNEAEEDFKRLKELTPSMASTVDKELTNIAYLRKMKDKEEKEKLKNLFYCLTI